MPVQNRYSLKGKIPDEAAQSIDDLYTVAGQLQSQITNTQEKLQQQITAAQQAIAQQGGQISQAMTVIPAAQLTAQGVSSGTTAQGSILPTPTGGLLYDNATANTIKWYYTGLIIYLPDGTVIPVPDTTVANPSILVSGLTPSTTYNFYPYYNVDRKQVLWALVPGGTGTPAAAYAAKSILGAQLANGDGNIGLSPASSVTAAATSGGGGGGGGGGSGCVRSSMVVQTRRSLLTLAHLQIGDEILGPTGWTFVERKKTTVQPHFIRFDFGRGDFLDVTPTEPMPNFQNGLRRPAKLWSMENMLKSRSGMPAVIQSISLVPESDQAVSLLLNPYHEFFVGGKRATLVLSNSVPVK